MDDRKKCAGNQKLDYLFDMPTTKYNETVKVKSGDKSKILCKEPYAQTFYDKLNGLNYWDTMKAKDLAIDEVYEVNAKSYSVKSRTIECEEVNSGTSVYINFNDYPRAVETLSDNSKFKVMITRNHNGTYYGSCRKYEQIQYAREMDEMYANKSCFDVTITELIKGGFIALYKNSIKCFVPGAHAAPNVIFDFPALIGKTIKVMIDNYDYMSKLYIVSHKKYIKHSMPEKIHDIVFGKMYKGMLTDKPKDFGIFVEIDDYYTGLIHKTELKNYNEVKKQYKAGDFIDVYVKDVTMQQNDQHKYRIVLTLSDKNIDPNRLRWQNIKNDIEGKVLDYFYDRDNEKFSIIDENGGHIRLDVSHDAVQHGLGKYSKVIVYNVNVINSNIKFDFYKASELAPTGNVS